MSRYTGPRVKKVRALGVELPGLTRKSADHRPYPPGQHGPNRRRGRNESDFKKQLREKQKLQFNYGIREGQLRRLMKTARRLKGSPTEQLLILLERRLDNVVFRAGYMPTIPAARQFVRHGHIKVNGKRLDIPSYRVKPGDVIEIVEKHKTHELVTTTWAQPSLIRPDWLSVDAETMSTQIKDQPTMDSVPVDVNAALVIEYYARRS